ncbi:MAG: hypothetical protein LBU22_02325, partial [Dysgonamonadaceae bacterium]|nr:hypothetical protein [Dysgonamonadaceae bacterium]
EIVDSFSLTIDTTQCFPFITILFTVAPDRSCEVCFFNTVLIPPPPMPPEPLREVLLSEGDGFIGYKKYKDLYLVFLENELNKAAYKFIERDSLLINEEPFIKYDLYNCRNVRSNYYRTENIYKVNDEDRFVFIEKITY